MALFGVDMYENIIGTKTYVLVKKHLLMKV